MSLGSDWVKLFRDVADCEWSDCPDTVSVYIHLLCRARYKDGHYRGIELRRGQAVYGRSELANTCGITERKVRTAIERLLKSGHVTKRTTNKFTVVTITDCGFEEKEKEETANESSSKRPANDQQTTTNKDSKTVKQLSSNEDKSARVLPDYVDAEVWDGFVQMRKKKKKVMTDRAVSMLFGQFEKMHANGEDVNENINRSTMNGWTGIYSSKKDSGKPDSKKAYADKPKGYYTKGAEQDGWEIV